MNALARHIAKAVLSLTILGALALLVTNQVWYMHSHIDEHGRIYSHSHPYSKSNDDQPVKHHNHTHHSIVTYEQAGMFLIEESNPWHCCIDSFPPTFFILRDVKVIPASINVDESRGPPSRTMA